MENMGKIWKKPVSRAAAAAIYPRPATAAATTTTTTAAAAATTTTTAAAAAAVAAAANRLLEKPVEAMTIVQNFALILVENVVRKNIRNNKTDIKKDEKNLNEKKMEKYEKGK
jgi:3-oxoacyl-ACP reductase-like protein